MQLYEAAINILLQLPPLTFYQTDPLTSGALPPHSQYSSSNFMSLIILRFRAIYHSTYRVQYFYMIELSIKSLSNQLKIRQNSHEGNIINTITID